MPPRKHKTVAHFTCDRYPQLAVPALGVTFSAGVFDTEDTAVADKLRALPEHYGIREVSDDHAHDADSVREEPASRDHRQRHPE